MSVRVTAIKFNHIAGSLSTDAMAIRKNATQPVNVPEWVDGVSINPEDSPAAYCMKETEGNTITIQARFSSNTPEIAQVEVRAIDLTLNPPGPSGCAGFIVRLIKALIRAFFGNPLGEVQQKTVSFVNGDSGFVTFNLVNPNLWATGVGIHTTEWQWQYRIGGGAWVDMQLTRHRVYIVLEAPQAPWTQAAGSTQLPWTDVLDYSCEWARTAKTKDDAAGKVTEKVNALGPAVVEYDCPGGGDRHYATYFDTFDCTKFIERLKGGAGNGQYVNCTDCATIVTTFTNVLGGELWASRMEGWFALNPILGIGSAVWQTACGWGGFGYHEVAWKNGCTQNDQIFDACLKVDGDANPTAAPHTPLLPVNMLFGDCTTMNYRLRLCPPGSPGCGTCIPNPGSKVRRTVF